MRSINQRFFSKCLKGRRNNPPDTSASAKKAWRRTNKQDIRKACYKQQRGLCAYTEISLDNATLGHHLEHIAPRSDYPERTFLPNNIILSTLGDVQSGNLIEQERFGGHHKSEQYSDDWFISPFNPRCTAYFSYEQNGTVEASADLTLEDQQKALQTIAVLNLNAEYLVTKRCECLQALKKEIEGLSHSAASALASDLFGPHNKILPEFYSAKHQLFASYGVG